MYDHVRFMREAHIPHRRYIHGRLTRAAQAVITRQVQVLVAMQVHDRLNASFGHFTRKNLSLILHSKLKTSAVSIVHAPLQTTR